MAEVRRDIVTDTWVIIQTGETDPNWRVQPTETRNAPDCPFCPGHEARTPPEIWALRPNGLAPNGTGWLVRVVPSQHPILRVEGELKRIAVGMHDMVTGIGANEVIIETPEHGVAFADLAAPQIAETLRTYRRRIADLYQDQRLRYVMVFKNHGAGAGATVPGHAHSELIALPATPRRIKDELSGARAYFQYKERCVFCDIIENELEVRKRLVVETPHFVGFAPYASRFPYELCIMPRRHAMDYENAPDEQLNDLAGALKRSLVALARVLGNPAYNFVLHTAPNRLLKPGYWGTLRDDYHWHLEIIPRIRRVAGFEWGSGFHVNPVAPETAANALREKM